ncbi:MAG TPA: ATP-binding protein, partial [Vicinamibacterales bacterium]|nr:ATP-binding protein [Vicinamibacterales bacterium]
GTQAAEMLATELGTTVYRIDLERIASKYIGETEKHLDTVFADAERAGAVLLMDEADALFGKRTGVKDSHDRYANLDTGSLLARVEEYNGVVLLATNLRTNIDPAFTRRLRRVIDYTPR